MSQNYYGPTVAAAREVNALLALEATGWEQDWEIEFADASIIDEMLDVLEREQLRLEVKAALCLLMLSSFEVGFEVAEVNAKRMKRAANLIQRDADLLAQMRFYWLDLGRANHADLMRKLL